MNQSLNSNILTPKGRNNPGIFGSLSVIGLSATMTNGSGLTQGATAGGAADTSGEGSIDIDNSGNNATDVNNINY